MIYSQNNWFHHNNQQSLCHIHNAMIINELIKIILRKIGKIKADVRLSSQLSILSQSHFGH